MLESLFNKVASLKAYLKETPTQVFSFKYCEIFKNTYLEEHLEPAASVWQCCVFNRSTFK